MTIKGYPFGFNGVGESGTSVLNGSGAPSGSLGRDGDFYIDTSVYDIYGPKTAGAWGTGTTLVGDGGGGVTLPPGGDDNDYLARDGIDGDLKWSHRGLVPDSSVEGYYLRQMSGFAGDYDFAQVREVPEAASPADDGKVLASVAGVPGWVPVREVPETSSPADDGKVLTSVAGVPGWAVVEDTPPSGSAGQLQYHNGSTSPAFAGAQYAGIENDVLHLTPPPSQPATPTTGLLLFARTIAGRMFPAYVGPSGQDASLQPLLARNKIAQWVVNGSSSSAATGQNIVAPTITGSASTRNVATTNILTAARRLGAGTTTPAGQSAGWRLPTALFFRNTSAENWGGFFCSCRFGESSIVAGSRGFIGMSSSTAAPTNVNPSTLLNIIGAGYDSGDTNWYLMHNDASGAATKISMGASFPSNTSNEIYEISIFCVPGASDVSLAFTRLSTGDIYIATLTTDLPASKLLLSFRLYVNNGATGSSKSIDLIQAYFETDQ